MITCHRKYLEARCQERGYTLDEVRGCIVSEDGDQITVDTEHPAYPRKKTPEIYVTVTPKEEKGPGAELKKLLKKWFGIVATPNCKCNARAKTMDENGCEWCEQNIDTIVGWLREEAEHRKLPFSATVGKILVKRAIANALKEEKNERQSD